uniref:Uncharacterized protein n=1 Tax=Sipha flava TaxID=143950 RepID=A0A2S2R0U8_9HEMI
MSVQELADETMYNCTCVYIVRFIPHFSPFPDETHILRFNPKHARATSYVRVLQDRSTHSHMAVKPYATLHNALYGYVRTPETTRNNNPDLHAYTCIRALISDRIRGGG